MLLKFNKLLWQIKLGICLLLGQIQVYADGPVDISEYQVKATFLLNFGKFVTYPETVFASSNSDYAICVLGEDPFHGSLNVLFKDEKIQGRTVRVIYLWNTREVNQCQTLFISQSEQKQLSHIISSIKRKPILTVSDIENFVVRGGMIQFYILDGRVRFFIDPTTANEAELQLSSRLLQVAKIIKK